MADRDKAGVRDLGDLQFEFFEAFQTREVGKLGVADRRGREVDRDDVSALRFGCAAESFDPGRDGVVRLRSGLGGARGFRFGRGGADEAHVDVGQRGMESVDAVGRDAGVAEVDVGQVLQGLQFGQAGVRDVGAVEVQDFELVDAAQDVHGGIRGLRAEQIQAAHGFHVCQKGDAFIGDAGSGEIEFFEMRKIFEVLQPFVGDQAVTKQEAAQVFETGDSFHALIGEGVVAEVQIAQFGERREVQFGEAALRTAEVL